MLLSLWWRLKKLKEMFIDCEIHVSAYNKTTNNFPYPAAEDIAS